MKDEKKLDELAELGPDLTADDIRHLTYNERDILEEKIIAKLLTYATQAVEEEGDDIYLYDQDEQRGKEDQLIWD